MTEPQIQWREDAPTPDAEGVVERGFTIEGDRDTITGILWAPATIEATSPLVLIGHGGGGNKRAATVLPTGRGFVIEHGIPAVCIDAPGHGERGGAQSRTPEYYALWKDAKVMTDNAIADWKRVLTAFLATSMFDAERVGWSGMSMGSLIGVPYVATEPRIRAAALGLCGLRGETPGRGTAGEVLAAAAPGVTVPLVFMMQWDDERFERQSQFELFDLFGASDKRLSAHPGAHGEMPQEGRRYARAFLAERLRG